MKRKILFLILFINCVFACFAIPVVEKTYDSDYHQYYCSEVFDSRKNEVITILDDCNYFVVAYDPQTSVRFIIQFRNKADAMGLVQQYKSITGTLRSTESQAVLDTCSYKISVLIRCYVQTFRSEMDYISSGYIYRYANPLNEYKTLEEYEASQKKNTSETKSSAQYRPCSLF